MASSSVWASIPSIIREAPSLSQVADEELARKLEEEERFLFRQHKEALEKEEHEKILQLEEDGWEVYDPAKFQEESLDDGWEFYEPTQLPKEKPSELKVILEENTQDQDEDLALALALQEEENLKATLSRIRQPKDNDLALVKVGSSTLQGLELSFHADCDSESDLNEDVVERPKSNSKLKIRMGENGEKEFITKHDPFIASQKNADSMEKKWYLAGVESGDFKEGKERVRLPNPVYNSLKKHSLEANARRVKNFERKEEVATLDKVMDTGTRVQLLKLMNSDIISNLSGVISAGKEAHVYHALAGSDAGIKEGCDLAVKVFKTSKNEFRKRAQYLEGEFRLRHHSSHAKKMIKVWAEKEFHNLKRLERAGISSPEALICRNNILIMRFIGKNGWSAPKLEEAIENSSQKLEEVYFQAIKLARDMYQKAHLVHSDLSEFNLLWFQGRLWVIDLGQAVEHDHPNSLLFLRRDLVNITTFFQKRGLSYVLPVQKLFAFVTDSSITDQDILPFLFKARQEAIDRLERGLTNQEQVSDQVFLNSFIPRTLSQVKAPEEELTLNNENLDNIPLHLPVTGLKMI